MRGGRWLALACGVHTRGLSRWRPGRPESSRHHVGQHPPSNRPDLQRAGRTRSALNPVPELAERWTDRGRRADISVSPAAGDQMARWQAVHFRRREVHVQTGAVEVPLAHARGARGPARTRRHSGRTDSGVFRLKRPYGLSCSGSTSSRRRSFREHQYRRTRPPVRRTNTTSGRNRPVPLRQLHTWRPPRPRA